MLQKALFIDGNRSGSRRSHSKADGLDPAAPKLELPAFSKSPESSTRKTKPNPTAVSAPTNISYSAWVNKCVSHMSICICVCFSVCVRLYLSPNPLDSTPSTNNVYLCHACGRNEKLKISF